jgi:cytochrome oxidase Cu insertion factor (SCO1/SenC/PrrC family)
MLDSLRERRIGGEWEESEEMANRIFSLLMPALIGAMGLVGGFEQVHAQSKGTPMRKAASYACPMHSEVKSRKPGKCPKCGMTLRIEADKDTLNSTASRGIATPEVRYSSARGAAIPVVGNAPSLLSSRIPDVTIFDQDGSRLKFYSDLIKGKTVAINFIFTTCTTICPPLTANFRRVQQNLAQGEVPVHLISISVDPSTDTPERLRDFAAKFKAGPGWTFVTGDKADIDSLLQEFGVAVASKNDHTPMILIGNDVNGYWTRTYGLSSPTTLTNLILEAANNK